MSSVTRRGYLICSDEPTLKIQGENFPVRLLATRIQVLDDVFLDEFFPGERSQLVPKIFGGQTPDSAVVYLSSYSWAFRSLKKPLSQQTRELLGLVQRPAICERDRIEKVYQLIVRTEIELADRASIHCQQELKYLCKSKVTHFIKNCYDFVGQFGLDLGTQLSDDDLVVVKQAKGITASELKLMIKRYR